MRERIDIGKWSERGVPHKGWRCNEVVDLGPSNVMTCQMCEMAQIRYVHVMVHEEYAGPLSCGCICAGHMSGDLAAAKQRDSAAKSAARKREAFAFRQDWRPARGGEEIFYKDRLLQVFSRGGVWHAVMSVYPRWYSFASHPLTFGSVEEAKMGAFDLATALKSPRRGRRGL